ncbi:MAG: phosphoribosyltransferase family protein [Candidatus Saccharimonadales bacterium]
MDISTSTEYSLFFDTEGGLASTEGNFDREAYSRMKYGDKHATKDFAEVIAQTLLDTHEDVVADSLSPAFVVAYKEVPPACFYLSKYCLDLINPERERLGLEPGEIIRMYKGSVTASDYAKSSASDRAKELDSIDFSFTDKRPGKRPVVVLDDIRISGGAERKVLDVLAQEPVQPRIIHLGYIAIFDAQQAQSSPHVESELNGSAIAKVTDLLPAIQDDNFDLNIRTLKMILSSDQVELEQFMHAIPEYLVDEIVSGAVMTGDDFLSQYDYGFDTIVQVANERGLL